MPESESVSLSVSLWITGDAQFDATLITSALDISPTEIWRCRPEVAEQHPDLDRVSWVFEETLEEIQYANALRTMLEKFLPFRDKLGSLADTHQLDVTCHLVPEGSARSFVTTLDADLIEGLAQLKSGLCIHNDRLTD